MEIITFLCKGFLFLHKSLVFFKAYIFGKLHQNQCGSIWTQFFNTTGGFNPVITGKGNEHLFYIYVPTNLQRRPENKCIYYIEMIVDTTVQIHTDLLWFSVTFWVPLYKFTTINSFWVRTPHILIMNHSKYEYGSLFTVSEPSCHFWLIYLMTQGLILIYHNFTIEVWY